MLDSGHEAVELECFKDSREALSYVARGCDKTSLNYEAVLGPGSLSNFKYLCSFRIQVDN